jgi:hypothetical protein
MICETQTNLERAQESLASWKHAAPGVSAPAAIDIDSGMIQAYTQILSARKKLFLRDRKKPFDPALCPPAQAKHLRGNTGGARNDVRNIVPDNDPKGTVGGSGQPRFGSRLA